MADELNLEAFLSDISARDDFLKNSAPGTGPDLLPPVRGAPVVEEITKPRSTKKAPKAAAAVAAPPSGPKDEADIWDAAEVPSLQDEARPATAPATSGGNGIPAAAKEVKPRQRKHAYEYFNQWDAYDVDGELGKLDDAKGKAARAEMDKLVGRDVNERLKGVSPASKEEVAAFAVKVHACLEQYPPHMR